MQPLVKYLGACKQKYDVNITNASLISLMVDKNPSECFSSRPRATNMHYAQFGKLLLNNSDLLSKLMMLSREATWERTWVHCLSTFFLNRSKADREELMIGTTDYFIHNLTKSTQFHASSFRSQVRFTLVQLCHVYIQLSTNVQGFFLLTWRGEIQGKPGSSWKVKQIFPETDVCLSMHQWIEITVWKNIWWSVKKPLVPPGHNAANPDVTTPAPLSVQLAGVVLELMLGLEVWTLG